MLLLTKEQAHKIDKLAQEQLKIPLILLMENAGAGLCQVIKEYLESLKSNDIHQRKSANISDSLQVLFVCGVGNNGADGLVCARHLHEYGVSSVIIIIGSKEKQSDLFNRQMAMIEALNLPIYWLEEGHEEYFRQLCNKASLIVDGIAGTGLDGSLRESVRSFTSIINQSNTTVIAIDVPSGLMVNTGSISEDTIQADVTVTMGMPKIGMFLNPGKQYCGRIISKPLGGPNKSIFENQSQEKGRQFTYLGDQIFNRNLLPIRANNAHKGTNGHVLVIGGLRGMWGAPLLAASGALHSGAGKVTIACPEESYQEIMIKAEPEIMGYSMAVEDILTLRTKQEEFKRFLNDKDVIIIGPGLGRYEQAQELVTKLISIYEGPLVIDADGLYEVNQYMHMIREREIPVVLTPHVGEFARMTGYTASKIESERVDVARTYALTHKVILLLKGAPTVIAYPDGTVIINGSGNPGMGTGGMGDVLSGIIGSFLGQGLSPEESATLGAYLHGLSADLLYKDTYIAFTPSEVAKHIGKAMLTL